MLHGPPEYGVDDGKFTEYYRAYVIDWSSSEEKLRFYLDPVMHP